MAGVAICNIDTAGGIIRSAGNTSGFYKGNPIALVGDPVDPHGKSPHSGAVILPGPTKGFIKGQALVLAGHRASCGHVVTGRPDMSERQPEPEWIELLPRYDSSVLFVPMVGHLEPVINPEADVEDVGLEKTEEGYRVSGLGQYLSLPNDVGIVDKFTVAGRIKVLGTPGQGYHILFGGSACEISVPVSERSIRTSLIIDNVRHVYNSGAGKVIYGEWSHLAFTFREGLMSAYIEGELVGEHIVPKGKLTTNHVRRVGNYGSSQYSLNGLVKDVIIYNEDLTANEIKRLYEFDSGTIP